MHKNVRMGAAGRIPILRSRHLTVTISEYRILVSYEPPFALTLGSTLRARDIRSRAKSFLKRARPVVQSDDGRISAHFRLGDVQSLKGIVQKVDLMLDAYPRERLTSRMVEEVLGITAAERRRWYKDGRLSNSGTASFRQG